MATFDVVMIAGFSPRTLSAFVDLRCICRASAKSSVLMVELQSFVDGDAFTTGSSISRRKEEPDMMY
jgi:hypothetical protein